MAPSVAFGRSPRFASDAPSQAHSVGGFALLLLLAALACTGCTDGTRAPKGLVVLGSEAHDFGRCRQGEVLTHEFRLRNDADVPVKIEGLTTSCSCLAANDLGPTTIAPGGIFALPIHFTTGAAQDAASGIALVSYRHASASSDSGPLESLRLRVRADVVPDYRISPSTVDFGVIDGLAAQQVSRTVRVVPEARQDVEVLEATSTSEFLDVERIPQAADVSWAEIKLVLNVSQFTESRSFSGSVVLATDNERRPKSVLRIHGEYVAPAQAEPGMIVIGSDEPGEVEREIRVLTSCPALVRHIGCSADEGQVRAEFDDDRRAREHVVQVVVAPCPERSLDCDLEIELELLTEDARRVVRALRIPVHRLLQERDEHE